MASREAHLRVIKINVGGHIYATTLRTLTKVPDSYLCKNFKNIASVPLPRDEAGYYFIDRDGPLFRHVLNYLRSVKVGRDMNLTGRVHLPEEFHEANQRNITNSKTLTRPTFPAIRNHSNLCPMTNILGDMMIQVQCTLTLIIIRSRS